MACSVAWLVSVREVLRSIAGPDPVWHGMCVWVKLVSSWKPAPCIRAALDRRSQRVAQVAARLRGVKNARHFAAPWAAVAVSILAGARHVW